MNRLKELRTISGLSQSALARKAGINVRTLQDYEQGRANLNGIALSAGVRLAAAMGCDTNDLLDEPLIHNDKLMSEMHSEATKEAEAKGTSNCPLCRKGGSDRIWDKDQMVIVDTGQPELMCMNHYYLAHTR